LPNSYRLIGATIIVFGLYALIWGKNKDHVNGSDAENNFEKHRTTDLNYRCEQNELSRQHLAVTEAAV
jgi:hypothetical protein